MDETKSLKKPCPPESKHSRNVDLVRSSHSPLLARNKYLKSKPLCAKDVCMARQSLLPKYVPSRHEVMFKRYGSSIYADASPRRREQRLIKHVCTRFHVPLVTLAHIHPLESPSTTIGTTLFVDQDRVEHGRTAREGTHQRNQTVNDWHQLWAETYGQACVDCSGGKILSFDRKFCQPHMHTTSLAVDLFYGLVPWLPIEVRPLFLSVLEHTLSSIYIDPSRILDAKATPVTRSRIDKRSILLNGMQCKIIAGGYRNLVNMIRDRMAQLHSMQSEINDLKAFNVRADELLRRLELTYQARPCFALWFLNMRKFTLSEKRQEKIGIFLGSLLYKDKKADCISPDTALLRKVFIEYASHTMKSLARRDIGILWRVNVQKEQMSKVLNRTIESAHFLMKMASDIGRKVESFPAKFLEKRRFVELVKSKRRECDDRALREQSAQNAIVMFMKFTQIVGPLDNEALVIMICTLVRTKTYKIGGEHVRQLMSTYHGTWKVFVDVLPVMTALLEFIDPEALVGSPLHVLARIVKARCPFAENRFTRSQGIPGWGWYPSFQAIKKEYERAVDVVHLNTIRTFKSAGEKNIAFLRFRRESVIVLERLKKAKAEFSFEYASENILNVSDTLEAEDRTTQLKETKRLSAIAAIKERVTSKKELTEILTQHDQNENMLLTYDQFMSALNVYVPTGLNELFSSCCDKDGKLSIQKFVTTLYPRRKTQISRRRKSTIGKGKFRIADADTYQLDGSAPPPIMTDNRKMEWDQWEKVAHAARLQLVAGNNDETKEHDLFDAHSYARQNAIMSHRRKELATLARFQLPKDTIDEFASREVDVERVKIELTESMYQHAIILRKIYDHYKVGKRLDRPNYLRMIHESRVIDRENLRAPDCELMWIKCATVPHDGSSNKKMMGPVAFVETVVRLARMKYAQLDLLQGIQRFVVEMSEYAIQSSAKEWRHKLTDDVFARVLHRRGGELVHMHNFWSGGRGRTEMSNDQWVHFVNKMGLAHAASRLGVTRISELFHNAQHDDDPEECGKTKQKIKDDGEHDDKHANTMNFGEFVEALATAILFENPDPYEPVAVKFERYVVEKIWEKHSKYAALMK